MLQYRNTVIEINGMADIPAIKASVSQGAAISARKVQAPNMFHSYGVNAAPDYQLSVDFPVVLASGCTTGHGFGYLHSLTGDTSFTVAIGKTQFNRCFLESLSLRIQPNTPIFAQASIKMFRDDFQAIPSTGQPYNLTDLTDKIAYGHNVTTGSFNSRADNNISTCAYSVNCQRSYSFPIWGAANQSGEKIISFLDSVDKKIEIQCRNMDDLIPYTGYSGDFLVTMSGQSGQTFQVGVSGNSVIANINHDYEAGRNGISSISLMQVVY